jgi:Lysylphosphatidylglycerol synthase TM region
MPMLDQLHASWQSASHAIGLIVAHAASVDVRLLAAGTILYFVAQAVRTRGWYTILRAAYPGATGLRAGHVARAYLAGAGVNAIVPARGGDVIKLAMVHRRIDGSRYPTLAATFVPDALCEAAFGAALVGWALANGFLPVPTANGELPTVDVSLAANHPITSALVAAAATAVGWLLVRLLRAQLRQGAAILAMPRRFLTGVVSWQALARLIRLGSLAAFMAAFGLPVTTATVVLVMAAQGGGCILPLAPASAGLRLALLSYGFVQVTGQHIDIATITAFTFGVSAVLALAGLVLALTIIAGEFGTLSPRRALAIARQRAPGPGWTKPVPASSTTGASTSA